MSAISIVSDAVKSLYVVRCPGGPIRLLGFHTTPSEDTVKDNYLGTFTSRRREVDDEEAKWPLLRVVTRDEVVKHYPHLLAANRRTGNPKHYFEFGQRTRK